MKLRYIDLLSNDPIPLEGVGTLKPPTLRDIKKIYDLYNVYTSFLVVDVEKYLEIMNLKDKYSNEEIETLHIYDLIKQDDKILQLYIDMFSFFFIENVFFDKKNEIFVLWKEVIQEGKDESKKVVVGYINKDNFDEVRDCIAQLNHLKVDTELDELAKSKNKRVKKILDKIKKGQASLNKNQPKLNIDLSKMISKYCADNKCGINLLNVFDMTVYQFYDQFIQHRHIREADLYDAIYSNTISYNDIKSYDINFWLK